MIVKKLQAWVILFVRLLDESTTISYFIILQGIRNVHVFV